MIKPPLSETLNTVIPFSDRYGYTGNAPDFGQYRFSDIRKNTFFYFFIFFVQYFFGVSTGLSEIRYYPKSGGLPVMTTFWEIISEWLTPVIFQYTTNLTCVNILFGILPYTIGNHCCNHCLLYCKFYVHLALWNNNTPTLKKFYITIKISQLQKKHYIF